MTKIQIFKITFFAVGLGLTSGLLLWNLWNSEVYDMAHTGRAIFKSVFIGGVTALILAILNAFFRIFTFKNNDSENSLNQ